MEGKYLEQNNVMRRNRKIWLILQILLVISIIVCAWGFYKYLNLVGYRVPIMDFWRWIAWFGEKFHTGAMSFLDFFKDKNEQVQPLALAIDFAVLEATKYDTQILVLSGGALKILIAVGLGGWFLWQTRTDLSELRIDEALNKCAVVLLILLVSVNPNQWELMTQPFSLTTSVRVLCFVCVFGLVSYLARTMFQQPLRIQLLEILALSFVTAAAALLMSGAYMAALLGAASFAFLLGCLAEGKNLKKTVLIPALIWIITVGGCFAAYMSMMGDKDITGKAGVPVIDCLKGFFVYLGAGLVPGSLKAESVAGLTAAGVLVLLCALWIFLAYFAAGLYKKTYMPILLFAYSVFNGVMIVLGRVTKYGAGTAASSRYTVESLLGIAGLVWAMGLLYQEKNIKKSSSAVIWIMMAAILAGTGQCCINEFNQRSYSMSYQDHMKTVMLHSDMATDEDFFSFQEKPEYVREAITFLRKNDFSIFNKMDPYVDGVGPDRWVESDLGFSVNAGEKGKIILHGVIPDSMEIKDNSVLTIYRDGVEIEKFPITERRFDIEFDVEPHEQANYRIQSNFNYNDGSDIRNLCYILEGIESL